MAEGLAREGFDADLAFGQTRESEFVQAIRDARVEIKSDQLCRVTGNVAIEYMQGGARSGQWRPSGISVTTAQNYIIEVDDDQWVMLRTSLLKALARRAIELGYSKDVGDRNNHRCALVPVEWLVRRFKVA
jgi:hypothetical protein